MTDEQPPIGKLEAVSMSSSRCFEKKSLGTLSMRFRDFKIERSKPNE